jgi:hypothetical protein
MKFFIIFLWLFSKAFASDGIECRDLIRPLVASPENFTHNLIIITHQGPRLQQTTFDLLASRESFNQVPRIYVNHRDYPLINNQLAKDIDYLWESVDGSIDIPLKAKKFHFFGGYCYSCLANSMASIYSHILKKEAASTEEVHFSLYTQAIYNQFDISIKEEFKNPPPGAFRQDPFNQRFGAIDFNQTKNEVYQETIRSFKAMVKKNIGAKVEVDYTQAPQGIFKVRHESDTLLNIHFKE